MGIAVYILSYVWLSILTVHGIPIQTINGPVPYEFNNHLGRAHKYHIVNIGNDRLHYRPNHAGYTKPTTPWSEIKYFDSTPVKVQAGSSVEIVCEVKGGPTPPVFWLEDNHELEKQIEEHQRESDGKRSWKGLSVVVSKYVIDCATPEDQKAIRCASIAGNTVQLSNKLQIVVEGNNDTDCENRLSKPIITEYTPTTLSLQGSVVILPCHATSNPKPYVYWINRVTNQRIDAEYVDKKIRFLPDGSLLFTSLSWDEMGTYTCVAKNYMGETSVDSFIYPLAMS